MTSRTWSSQKSLNVCVIELDFPCYKTVQTVQFSCSNLINSINWNVIEVPFRYLKCCMRWLLNPNLFIYYLMPTRRFYWSANVDPFQYTLHFDLVCNTRHTSKLHIPCNNEVALGPNSTELHHTVLYTLTNQWSQNYTFCTDTEQCSDVFNDSSSVPETRDQNSQHLQPAFKTR